MLLVNYLARVAPFGTIYTENGRLVLRFSELERPMLRRLLTRNRVSGDELGIQGFEVLSFRFYRDEVLIEPLEFSTNTVRLNNQPVTELINVFDGSWLGAMGRLYSFSFSDAEGSVVPATEDDREKAAESESAEGTEERA